jgi:hypothetical protein
MRKVTGQHSFDIRFRNFPMIFSLAGSEILKWGPLFPFLVGRTRHITCCLLHQKLCFSRNLPENSKKYSLVFLLRNETQNEANPNDCLREMSNVVT